MKYIRYIDEYDEERVSTYQDYAENVASLQDAGFDSECVIIKQSDAIEELCDEFVLCCNGFVRPNLLNNSRFKDAAYLVKKHNEQAKSYIIYGAIWADKGLIYVAKMNDEGELELL